MMSKVYCRSCRGYHRILFPSDDSGWKTSQPMARCDGMWWFVQLHETTGNPMPIAGATKLTRQAGRRIRRTTHPKDPK